MAFIYIKNKQNTSDKHPPIGFISWLDFWERKSGKEAQNCRVLTCSGPADIGGHVIKPGEYGKEYILPLCYKCNCRPETESFEAWDGDLVPVY